jgi:hypothetical protein
MNIIHKSSLLLCDFTNILHLFIQAHDRLTELEGESLAQLAALEAALGEARAERDELMEGRRVVEEEVATLRRVVNDQRLESANRQSVLEDKIQELISTLPRDSSKF